MVEAVEAVGVGREPSHRLGYPPETGGDATFRGGDSSFLGSVYGVGRIECGEFAGIGAEVCRQRGLDTIGEESGSLAAS